MVCNYRHHHKKVLLGLLGIFLGGLPLLAQEYDFRISYLYEVANQLALSDFELGSDETIRDQDGNGFGVGWVFKKGNNVHFELDLGYTRTVYRGPIEDGGNVTFVPQEGTEFEAISTSTNVVYDFDVTFHNPFVGVNVLLFKYFRLGGGRILQSVDGEVKLKVLGFEIVQASYEPTTQLYYQGGVNFAIESVMAGVLVRQFEAPALKIKSCNEAALGSLLCSRVRGATGNRNQRTNIFGGGIIHISFLF